MSEYKARVAPGSIGNCTLGEGPHWDPVKKELLYVDIIDKAVFRYVPATQEASKVVIDAESVSLVVPVEGAPNKYVITTRKDVKVMEWDGKSGTPTSLKTIHSLGPETGPKAQFNDGKCDTHGRLWAGTMSIDPTSPTHVEPKKGVLYSFDLGGKAQTQAGEIDIANGLAWSPDNSVMYYIDSGTYRVDAFDYDADAGTIKNRRAVFDFKANNIEGLPDGMTIDTNGNLWVAMFNGHKVVHIDPKVGKQVGDVRLPASNITSVAFGGPNLDILYATSARFGLTKENLAGQEDAGALFEITNLGAKGLTAGINYKGPV